MSLAEIKTAIERLSFEQRAELAAWFHGWRITSATRLRQGYGAASEQMKRDVAAVKLDSILHEVEEDIKAGRVRKMP